MSISLTYLPSCPKCDGGTMLPFEDTNKDGNAAYLKVWVCNNHNCKHYILFKSGAITVDGEIINPYPDKT